MFVYTKILYMSTSCNTFNNWHLLLFHKLRDCCKTQKHWKISKFFGGVFLCRTMYNCTLHDCNRSVVV